jgi:hypothetical protein
MQAFGSVGRKGSICFPFFLQPSVTAR